MQYNNILIIQTAFIGDAILASSLLEKLHSTFPSSQISILVRQGNEQIYQDHPFLKDVLVWNKGKNKRKNLFSLLKEIRKKKFDCVVNCHRYFSSGLLSAFSGAKHIAGFKENPFSFMYNHTARHKIGDGTHETARYQRLIEDFTDDAPALPRLYPSAADREKVQPLLSEKFICMAPASVWFTKQLPAEKWVELCNRADEGTKIFLLGAPDDIDLCGQIKEQTLHKKTEVLAGKLSLLQSCELMRHASMNYVNDSAPLHLASAVNAPVTAFFCSTVPAFGFGPLSDQQTTLGVDELPCRPCGLHGYRSCPLGHFKCGRLMPLPETV